MIRRPLFIIVTLVCAGAVSVGPAAAGGVTAENPDVAALLALHEGALAAHRAGDIDALTAPESDDYVLGNRGTAQAPWHDPKRGASPGTRDVRRNA